MAHGYRAFTSPAGATSTVTGLTVDMGASTEDVYVHVDITGTATVVLEASMDDENWIAVTDPLTTSTVWVLSGRIPFYRGRVTAYTSGTVSCRWGPAQGHHDEMSNVASPIQTSGGPS